MSKRVASLLFSTVLAACSSVTSSSLVDRDTYGSVESLAPFDELPEAVTGVWESRGYGWIFEIDAEGLTQYQVAGDACFRTPEEAKGLTDTLSIDYQLYRPGVSPDMLILQLLPEDTEIHLKRIDALPSACLSEPDSSPEAVIQYMASLVGENYAFFEERGIDWPQRVEVALDGVEAVQSDAALFERLAEMIDGFSDSHTKLIATVDGENQRQQDGLGETLSFIRAADQETPWLIGIFTGLMEDVLDQGSQHTANDRILWGTIDNGRVGYIQILQMGGFSGVDIGAPEFRDAEFEVFDAVMDEALMAMSGSEFVILDLSNNRGGYDAISRRVASRFTDEAFDAYISYVPGSGVAPRMRMVYPADGARYTGPVKLLTSDVTVSGGEIATLALNQLPNVTQYGGTTRGSFSTVLSKPLPNGWVVELANEVVAAPDGTSYEETGIAPDIEMDVFPKDDPVAGHRRAIETLARVADPG